MLLSDLAEFTSFWNTIAINNFFQEKLLHCFHPFRLRGRHGSKLPVHLLSTVVSHFTHSCTIWYQIDRRDARIHETTMAKIEIASAIRFAIHPESADSVSEFIGAKTLFLPLQTVPRGIHKAAFSRTLSTRRHPSSLCCDTNPYF